MKRLRVLLADDQPQILNLLQRLLEPDYHVLGTVEDGQSLVAAAQALKPDIVLTDVDMPVVNGIDATRELHPLLPDCRVIFYSSHGEPEVVAAAFAAGASGYLIKGSTQSLISSIRAVIRQVSKIEEPIVVGGTGDGHMPYQAYVRSQSPLEKQSL
jgi:DNA-binding NarL/FixJ family response regulator